MPDSFRGLAMRRPTVDARDVLASVSTSAEDGSEQLACAGPSGISVTGPGSTLVDADGLFIAVSGYPRWSDKMLADTGAESGPGRALVEAYRKYGADLVTKLRGPFAIAVIDTSTDFTLIAIDRLGTCQLFYSLDGNGELSFATHGDLPSPDETSPIVSDQALYNYLYFHMIPSPYSIFENRHKLQPGERIVLQNGKIVRERYWTPEFDCHGKANRRELEVELHELLRAAVRESTGESTAGSFLSGGIDSSTLAGMLSEIRDPAPTFTIGFDEKGYDETSFARITSTHFGTQQNEYFVTPGDVVDILPVIARTYDEPFGNSSVVPTYFCARMASESGISTLLAGDGGDELFGGNTRYVTQQIFGIYDRTPDIIKSALIDPIALKMPGGDRFMPTRKLRSYVRQAKVQMPDRLETYNYFHRTPVAEILHPSFLSRIDETAPAGALRETYNSARASSMLNRMLALDWKITLADNDLRKVSTMCDLAGVAVRFPFLDDDIVEFSARVPANLKIRRFKLRHFFKHAMKNYLPTEVLRKSKHGFGLPFGVWMKSYRPLQELAYDCLEQIGKRNILQPAYLKQLKEAHQSTHAHYYGEFIWVCMMLELWLTQHGVRYECPVD